MSRRELQALTRDPGHVLYQIRLRGEERSESMDDHNEEEANPNEKLAEELHDAKNMVEAQKEEIDRLQELIAETTRTLRQAEARADDLQQHLERMELRSELDHLRAIERLH